MKAPVSEFDQAEFSRYRFEDGKVIGPRGRPLTPLTQTNPQGRQYSYYSLVRDDGVTVKVSTALVSGRVTYAGGLYHIDHFPRGWEARAGFPAYIFHPEKRKIRRVAFASPRQEPVDLKPNKVGQYRLLTPAGYQWYHVDDLFA